MVSHARDLFLHFSKPAFERDSGRWLPAFGGASADTRSVRSMVPAGPGKAFVPCRHRIRLQAGESWHPLGHVQFVERQSRIGINFHQLWSHLKRLQHRLAGFIAAGQCTSWRRQITRSLLLRRGLTSHPTHCRRRRRRAPAAGVADPRLRMVRKKAPPCPKEAPHDPAICSCAIRHKAPREAAHLRSPWLRAIAHRFSGTASQLHRYWRTCVGVERRQKPSEKAG